MVVFSTAIFIIIAIVGVVVLVVNIPQICVFETCFRLVPFEIGGQITFWMLFVFWLTIQAAFIFLYTKIIMFIIRLITRGELLNRFLNFSRDLFNRF